MLTGHHTFREVGTLNDFREFFGLDRHENYEKISKNVEIQDALRELYDHPDKVELYPGVFCESLEDKGADPGPTGLDSALWSAIFSDAITLIRSDRFYTVVRIVMRHSLLWCVVLLMLMAANLGLEH